MSAPERVEHDPATHRVDLQTGGCLESGCSWIHHMTQEPSVVDQVPTDVGVPVPPDLCGTFAVYLLPDGTAGLVLAVEGEPEPRRLLLPKMIVDMVIHGKKPSLKDAMGLLGGLR